MLRARPTLALLLLAGGAAAQLAPTVGLQLKQPGAGEAYTLFTPNSATTTFLVDDYGRLVHSWAASARPGLSVYLLDDGTLLRPARIGNPTFSAGGAAGRLDRYDWDGQLIWQYSYSTADHHSHHDVAWLPSGNVLMIAWERKTAAEALAAGRDPALLSDGELWPDHVIEVQPTLPTGGTIVWRWHLWDHLVQDFDPAQANFGVVADHPELVDLNHVRNAGPADWNHTNGIDYNPELDQIVLSVHGFDELWVIDHSTSTAEAAGHSGGRYGKGGDLLYRWGNPATYGAGTTGDQQLFRQHDARWIPPGLPGAGNLTIFNNGNGRTGGNYSSVEEIAPPVDGMGNYTLGPGPAYEPASPTWTYAATPPNSFYATNISGAHRLGNGDTLVCEGPAGRLFDVDPALVTRWQYVSPFGNGGAATQGDTGVQNATFRATRLDGDHPGLAGRDLTPGDPIETYPCAASPALLYVTRATSPGDLRLSWDPPCATRWVGRAVEPWGGPVGVPVAGVDGAEYIEPMPAEGLVFYFVH